VDFSSPGEDPVITTACREDSEENNPGSRIEIMARHPITINATDIASARLLLIFNKYHDTVMEGFGSHFALWLKLRRFS
jgi:hypothetical protein